MKTESLYGSRSSITCRSLLIIAGIALLFSWASPAQASTHYLYVINGTISGGGTNASYSGTPSPAPTIIANAPGNGMMFSTWSPTTYTYGNVTNSTTTVACSSKTTSVNATYVAIPVPHTLTVVAGSGSGSHVNGDSVPIVGNSPGVGEAFSQWKWDTNGNSGMFDSVSSSNTIFHMPNTNITITALYSNLLYTLTVSGGLGSGSYTTNMVVNITANSGQPGQPFDQWTVQSGGNNSEIGLVTSTNTTFTTLYPSNVTITANYKPSHNLQIIGDGLPDTQRYEGAVVTIAARINYGMVFSSWYINSGATTNMFDSMVLSPTHFHMPNNDVSISAGWTDAQATNTYVCMTNGTVSGATSGYFQPNVAVQIVANAPAPAANGIGWVFDQWTGAPTNLFGSIYSNSTSFMMPTSAVWISATYKNTYLLSITSGADGNGNASAYHLPADVVIINANDPPSGQVFLTWTGGSSNRFGNIVSPNTAYVMEPVPAYITATYINGIPNTNANPQSVLTTLSLVSVGTYKSAGRVVMVNGMRQQTWAQYALWSSVNGGIYFKDGEQFYGWVHSNDQLWFSGSPEFFDRCTSSAGSVGSGNSSTNAVVFHKGFNLNYPSNDVTTASFTNMLAQADLVLTGKTAITLSGTSLLITCPTNHWTNHTVALNGDMVVCVRTNGVDTNCNVSIGGMLNGRVTVVAERDILITNNLTYNCDPVTNSLSTDALGLIANNNVWVAKSAPNNLNIYCQIMATGLLTTNTTDGSFTVENYDTRAPSGNLTLVGGIAQNVRGAIGTFDAGTGNTVSGFAKNYRYDTRFATVPPPSYPPLINTLNFNQWRDQ